MQHDNAARRLYDTLTEALNVSAEIGDPSKVITRKVWDGVFGESNPSEMLADLDNIHYLIKLTRNSVSRLQRVPDKSVYIECLDDISSLIHVRGLMGARWIDLYTELKKPRLLGALAMTANAIDVESELLLLTEDQQQEILQAAEALLAEVTAGDIDKDLKVFLTVRLEEVCRAIRHYGMNGSEGLRIVIESNIGAAVLRANGLIGTKIGTSDEALWKRFMNLMLKGSQWLGLARNINDVLLPGIAEVAKYLPPGL